MDNYILLITKNNIWNNKFVSTTISLSEVQLAAICTMLYSMFKDEVEDYTKIVYNEFSVPIIDNSLEPVLEGVKAYRTSDVSEIDYQDRFIFKTDDNTSWYQCNEEFLNAC